MDQILYEQWVETAALLADWRAQLNRYCLDYWVAPSALPGSCAVLVDRRTPTRMKVELWDDD